MNDHAYLYANTPDKSIMYDLAVQCALVEVPAIPGGALKKCQPLLPCLLPPAKAPASFTSQMDEKYSVSSAVLVHSINRSPWYPYSQQSLEKWVSALGEQPQWLVNRKILPDVRALELEWNRVPQPRSILMINGSICQHSAENWVSEKNWKSKQSVSHAGKMAQTRGESIRRAVSKFLGPQPAHSSRRPCAWTINSTCQ